MSSSAVSSSRRRTELGLRDHLKQGFARARELDEELRAFADLRGEFELTLVLVDDETANSAFFGLRRRICDIGEAVAYLGLDLSKDVCAVGGTVDDARGDFREAVEVARLARTIAGGHERGAVAYAAALFDEMARLVDTNADERQVAVYLLDLWGIPRVVVDAVREQPSIAGDLDARTKLLPADAVYIAKCMRAGSVLPSDYLARVGAAAAA